MMNGKTICVKIEIHENKSMKKINYGYLNLITPFKDVKVPFVLCITSAFILHFRYVLSQNLNLALQLEFFEYVFISSIYCHVHVSKWISL